MCGVIDLSEKDYDAILPHDVIDELQQLHVASVMVAECVSTNDESSVSANVVNDEVVNESEDDDVDVSNGETCNNSDLNDEVVSDDVEKLIAEQKSDETLSDCWTWLIAVKVILSYHVVCCTIRTESKVSLSVSYVYPLVDVRLC